MNKLVYFLCALLWLAAIGICLLSNNPSKLAWVGIMASLPFIGPIFYFLIGRESGH